MGLFSKPKQQLGLPEDKIVGLVTKFQNWIPDSYTDERDGRTFTTADLRAIVNLLVRTSSRSEDELLLGFVGKLCAAFVDGLQNLSIEEIAQFYLGLADASLELRKKYAMEQSVSQGVVTLGLAVLSLMMKNPKFDEVLEYLRKNPN